MNVSKSHEWRKGLFSLLLVETILFAILVPFWWEISTLILSRLVHHLPFAEALGYWGYILFFRFPKLLAIPLLAPAWYFFGKEKEKPTVIFAALAGLILFFYFAALLIEVILSWI